MIFVKMQIIENSCYRTGKYIYTVCRPIHASFSPEILQAGAVEGLTFCIYSNIFSCCPGLKDSEDVISGSKIYDKPSGLMRYVG